MIQINLLPDVKQEMLRAQRMRNLAITIAIAAGVVSAAIVFGLGLFIAGQAIAESQKSGQIDSKYKQLSSISDLDDALTIQSQLDAISGQNDNRTRDSRLLDVLNAINPAPPNDVKLSKVSLDPTGSTLTLEGSAAGGYAATDVFKKTILHTTINSTNSDDETVPGVPLADDVNIVDASYGMDSSGNKVVRFKLSFVYPDDLFSNKLSSVKLSTPSAQVDVTDSRTRVPDSLFDKKASDLQGDQ